MNLIKKCKNWKSIKWKKIQVYVSNLQFQIFKHAKSGNMNQVRYCQRKLVRSEQAKLLAVRTITQDNRGKKVAGVDKISELSPSQRFQMVKKLVLDGKTSKIKQVLISKTNGKLRPVGIPTLEDRAKQCLVKLVLEPEWEARFETNSYGFRPGYSTSDAKWVIARQLQGGPKYFLDVSIKDCLDNIDHKYILKKLNTIKMFERQIQSWLKAGILSGGLEDFLETTDGEAPQCGVIIPLLINVAFHGMENYVVENLTKRNEIKVVRYANDFVIFAKTLKSIQKAKEIVKVFLKPIGLELSEEKTRIGHSMEKKAETESPLGLDFLGYHFRNVKCSIHRGVKSTQGKKQPFKLVTHPSKDAVKRHKANLRVTLKKYKRAPLGKMIERTASIIKEWTWYHSVTQCHKTFSKIDSWLWARLWRWACKRYKGRKNAKQKCFNVKGWGFGYIDQKTKIHYTLNRHDQTKVRKYIKIKADASVYDENLVQYFAERIPLTHPRSKNLIGVFNKQKYSCPVCDLLFQPNDIIELHHVIDDKDVRTGKLQLLHGHCHDRIHNPEFKSTKSV